MNISWQKYKLPELPETFWAYLAGLVDGDGCFGIYRSGARLNISNTHKETLVWLKESLGVGHVKEYGDYSQFNRKGPCYGWDCGSSGMRAFLPKLIPFLKIKKKEALVLQEYLNGITPSSTIGATEEELERRRKLKGTLKALKKE